LNNAFYKVGLWEDGKRIRWLDGNEGGMGTS